MNRRRIGLGIAAIAAVVAIIVAVSESGWYTMTVDADISAGVLQTTSCKIVDSRAADNSSEPVLSIRPVGRIWMFHSERLGIARVRCGIVGQLRYTFEVLRPARLELVGSDRVEVGKTIGFWAVGYAADGRRIISDVNVEEWRITGPLERKPGSSSCEFPPWCGGPGSASMNAMATAEGSAKVEAVIGNYARGEKTVTISRPP